MLGAHVNDMEMRERLVRLEADFENAVKRLDEINVKVSQMHEMMLKAKGAQWALIGLAGLAGFAASKFQTVIHWIGATPR
jgi:hypothetical protein